jgi:hypothetical protein
MTKPFFVPLILLFMFGCLQTSKKTQHKTSIVQKKHPIQQSNKLVPVFGYRFKIVGNFAGKNSHDTLTEHYISTIDHKETNKFYDGLSYDSLVVITEKKKPAIILTSNNKVIKDFVISAVPQLGLAYLKNEGDLNGDGTDEISYVINRPDWSNLNDCYIATYKNKRWHIIYEFEIWDWQLPDLPGTYNDDSFGRIGFYVIKDNAAEQKIEKEFNEFKGLIKKIRNSKIRIIYRHDNPENGAELDTTIVDLRKHHK